MKKILSIGVVCSMLICSAFMFFGCGREVVNVNVVDDAKKKAETLISTYYNKTESSELTAATVDNFYVELGSEIDSNVEVVTINGISHTAKENIKYSVGNNNFVETPAWIAKDGKLYVAVPTLYVEARSGVTTVIAGNKEIKATVFENAGLLKMDSVTVVGTTTGATAEKTTNENGKVVVNHTRTSGKSAVGWVLSAGDKKIPKDIYVFTKKVISTSNAISYGVDITTDADKVGYTQALYNYWLNGSITEPVNRTIDYTVAIPGYGNINFDINVTETVPAS